MLWPLAPTLTRRVFLLHSEDLRYSRDLVGATQEVNEKLLDQVLKDKGSSFSSLSPADEILQHRDSPLLAITDRREGGSAYGLQRVARLLQATYQRSGDFNSQVK